MSDLTGPVVNIEKEKSSTTQKQPWSTSNFTLSMQPLVGGKTLHFNFDFKLSSVPSSGLFGLQ